MSQYLEVNDRNNADHDVIMRGRKVLEITGVKQVESFDSEEFLLITVMGVLSVQGQNLQMKNLDVDQGIVSIKGRINQLVYSDETSKNQSKSMFSKLFK
ncbi:sporulation protein YabP [Bacillus ectoiniformans]|nr:sporulation protein YabP [Bacillus ectoiniformans]